MSGLSPYNPLDKLNLGESVARAALAQPVEPLPPQQFAGAGVYLIYYIGSFPVYEHIAAQNRDNRFEIPIYVGKAVPKGARKGGFGLGISPGKVLFDRLREHAESIQQVNNLDVSDFLCRYLVVDDIWIPLAESLLIDRFSPLWNKAIDGFGNHDPGVRRSAQYRSLWDTLHPGRAWAAKLQNNPLSQEQIIARLQGASPTAAEQRLQPFQGQSDEEI